MKYKCMREFTLFDGRTFDGGDEADLSPVDAKPLLKIGFIAPLKGEKIEKAIKEPVAEVREETEESAEEVDG